MTEKLSLSEKYSQTPRSEFANSSVEFRRQRVLEVVGLGSTISSVNIYLGNNQNSVQQTPDLIPDKQPKKSEFKERREGSERKEAAVFVGENSGIFGPIVVSLNDRFNAYISSNSVNINQDVFSDRSIKVGSMVGGTIVAGDNVVINKGNGTTKIEKIPKAKLTVDQKRSEIKQESSSLSTESTSSISHPSQLIDPKNIEIMAEMYNNPDQLAKETQEAFNAEYGELIQSFNLAFQHAIDTEQKAQLANDFSEKISTITNQKDLFLKQIESVKSYKDSKDSFSNREQNSTSSNENSTNVDQLNKEDPIKMEGGYDEDIDFPIGITERPRERLFNKAERLLPTLGKGIRAVWDYPNRPIKLEKVRVGGREIVINGKKVVIGGEMRYDDTTLSKLKNRLDNAKSRAINKVFNGGLTDEQLAEMYKNQIADEQSIKNSKISNQFDYTDSFDKPKADADSEQISLQTTVEEAQVDPKINQDKSFQSNENMRSKTDQVDINEEPIGELYSNFDIEEIQEIVDLPPELKNADFSEVALEYKKYKGIQEKVFEEYSSKMKLLNMKNNTGTLSFDDFDEQKREITNELTQKREKLNPKLKESKERLVSSIEDFNKQIEIFMETRAQEFEDAKTPLEIETLVDKYNSGIYALPDFVGLIENLPDVNYGFTRDDNLQIEAAISKLNNLRGYSMEASFAFMQGLREKQMRLKEDFNLDSFAKLTPDENGFVLQKGQFGLKLKEGKLLPVIKGEEVEKQDELNYVNFDTKSNRIIFYYQGIPTYWVNQPATEYVNKMNEQINTKVFNQEFSFDKN
ncbi:MAG: hypothetical protein ACRCXZ_00350 [Patescibacteria group bacterium]